MSLSCILYKYVCYEMNIFFFKVFINGLPKIHRIFLRKITIEGIILIGTNYSIETLMTS